MGEAAALMIQIRHLEKELNEVKEENESMQAEHSKEVDDMFDQLNEA